MAYTYGKLYPSSELPSELVNTPSGEVRYWEGIPYKVINEQGGRRLEAPSFTETGVRAEDRITTPEEFIASIRSELEAQMEEFTGRVKEFDTTNPFAFDEVLARQSAQERYNPYYEAELGDFISGIQRERESTEGERKLLVDLNQITAGAERRNFEEAVRASEEGYAGAGLFESGARRRDTGLRTIAGQEQTTEREKRFQFGQEQIGRGLSDIAQREATGRRRTTAEQTTTIESDIARQKGEERARYEYEKAQFVGYPYVKPTGGVNELLGYAFQY